LRTPSTPDCSPRIPEKKCKHIGAVSRNAIAADTGGGRGLWTAFSTELQAWRLSALRQRQRSDDEHAATMKQLEQHHRRPGVTPASERDAMADPDLSSVWDRPEFPPNHHGDARQFGGVFGYLAGLTMMVGRRRDAHLAMRIAELSSTDRLVDIGCGPGTAVRTAAPHAAQSIGVDPSRPMLRLAHLASTLLGGSRGLQWLQDGAEHLSLPNESTTVCWSIASVHHWPDLGGGVDEVRRILEPGGCFVAIERRTRAAASGNATHGWTPAQAVRFAQLLTVSGFDNVSVANHDLGRRHVVSVTGTRRLRCATE
jgi:SAM-dependent methyltransferase